MVQARPFNVTAACQKAKSFGRETWEPNILYKTLLVEQDLMPRPNSRWYMNNVYEYLLDSMPDWQNNSDPGMLLVHFGDL